MVSYAILEWGAASDMAATHNKTPIVVQLQQEAADGDASVTTLLRKALIVARKLRIDDFRDWLSNELDGYDPKSEVPRYRRLQGELKAHNPYQGWIPVLWEDQEARQRASTVPVIQSVAELEALTSGDPERSLTMRMAHLDQKLHYPLPVHLHVSQPRLLGILGTVRNIILNWALDLEDRGILGQDLSFSIGEKRVANAVNYEVNNFFGDGARAQFHQGHHGTQYIHDTTIDLADLAHLLEAIRDAFPNPAKQSAELAEHLERISEEMTVPSPDKAVLRQRLEAIRDVIVTAGAASALVEQIAQAISLLS